MGREGRPTSEHPVLIVGGSGQIGQHLAMACHARGWPVVATFYRNPQPGGIALDATDGAQVRRVVQRVQPWLIVNSLNTQGGTDACEEDPELAQRAHFHTACHLVDAARRVGAKLVQISTDYVFDGRSGPYTEDAVPAPLSQLGRAKLQAERYVLTQLPDALVIRTSCVFSWTPRSATKNFVMQVLEHDQAGELMRVPYDQIGNVTYASNLAEALVELMEGGASGLYHVAGTTRCSKYDWAMRVVEFFGLNPLLIQGASTVELGQVGPRPLHGGLCLDKVQAVLTHTRLVSLEEGLTDMAREMGLVGKPV